MFRSVRLFLAEHIVECQLRSEDCTSRHRDMLEAVRLQEQVIVSFGLAEHAIPGACRDVDGALQEASAACEEECSSGDPTTVFAIGRSGRQYL